MIRAPGNESPVGAVPETAHKEDDERVPDDFRLAYATASQGDIDIIPEPSSERNMPPAPKLCYVAAEIRHVEVAHQLDTKQLGRAYGNVGIARKVAVDLEGEENGGEKQCAARLVRVIRKHLVHIHGTIVGHHYLLEQAPKDLAHTVNSGVVIELPLLQELRQKVRCSLNGAGHQLREKRDEGEESDDVPGRLYLAPINVDGITQGLEGVERDSDRQNHFQQQSIRGDVEQLRELGDEEVVIFEQGKDTKIQDDIERRPKLGFLSCSCLPDEQSAAPRTERGESY